MPSKRAIGPEELANTDTRIPVAKKDLKRFLSKIECPIKGQNECVNWIACTLTKNRKGQQHGKVHWNGRWTYAHRVAYDIWIGEIGHGKCVLHKCIDDSDGRCVNPRHLELGSKADNMRDAAVVGNHRKKLTPHIVQAMRAMKADGKRQTTIAKLYGISETSASHVLSNKSKHRDWAWLE